MLRKIWKMLGVIIAIILLLLALFIVVGVFLSPIYLMIVMHWSAGFLFFVSWIPASFLLVLLGSIITLITD